MLGKDVLTMSLKEAKRIGIIEKVAQTTLTQVKAAEFLQVSSRQVRRLAKKFLERGPSGLIHGLRGKASNQSYPNPFKQKVLKLYQNCYEGFGPTLACEKLVKRDKISISDETLRNWLLERGLWEIRRKSRKHRKWREPKASSGEMIQMDGSHHDWLEGRGPWLVLMAYIDDATGRPYARFYDYEGTLPALDSFYRYVKLYGVPHSVYFDKHTTYKSPLKPTLQDQLKNEVPRSEFGRALHELGVLLIYAHSPQAKGRIERLFRTFQDRLIKEMRLLGVKTKEEANQFLKTYLPEFNQRFKRPPKNKVDLHRFVSERLLKRALSIREKRVLRNDNTVLYQEKLYQITSPWKGRRPKDITLEERLDGKLYLLDQDKELTYQRISSLRKRKEETPKVKPYLPGKRQGWIPRGEHPWRKLLFKSQRIKQVA